MRENDEKHRIFKRDRNRLLSLGYNLDEFKIVYLAYHSDNSDRDWLQDILLMTPAEKSLFKKNLPKYNPPMINKGRINSYKDSHELW